MAVTPLTKRTMALESRQKRTLAVLRKVRRQLRRAAHEPGMNDEEFIESMVEPLITDILQDCEISQMSK